MPSPLNRVSEKILSVFAVSAVVITGESCFPRLRRIRLALAHRLVLKRRHEYGLS